MASASRLAQQEESQRRRDLETNGPFPGVAGRRQPQETHGIAAIFVLRIGRFGEGLRVASAAKQRSCLAARIAGLTATSGEIADSNQ